MGLIGESGEIVDIMKKYMFQSKPDTPLPVDKLIDEMGDVMWYIAETVTGMEFSLKYALETSGGRRFRESITTDQYAVTLVSAAIEVYANCLVIYQERSALDKLCLLYDLLCAMCASIGTTIDHVMERNIEKLRKRYPDGFDPERSMNRPEYQREEETEPASGILFNERNRTV